MELEQVKQQTTWNDAAESINSNNLKIITEVTKLQNATYKNKGYFTSPTALQSAFPSASLGSKAYVGAKYPYAIYLWQNEGWVNSGQTGGEENVNLSQFYTKEETDSKITETATTLDTKLTELSQDKAEKITVEHLAESVHSQLEQQDATIETFKDAITEQIKEYKPITIEGNVNNAADEEDLTSEGNLLKLKDRTAIDGMGYVILRKNKTFAEQVTKTNTIYEIRYEFVLDSDVTIPADSVLKFVGGVIKGGKIIFNNTLLEGAVSIKSDIEGTIKNEYLTPQMFGAAGNGVADDTAIFHKLKGRNIQLEECTYLVSNLILNAGTRLNGVGSEKSIIYQSPNASGDCIRIEGYNSSITNLSIRGNRQKGVAGDDAFRALLKVMGAGSTSSYYFNMRNVVVAETTYSGIVLVGSSTGDPTAIQTHSWVYHIDNVFVKNCGCWCMIDESSDNTFSNISLSGGGLGNLWAKSGSNMYVNIKLDGQAGHLSANPESDTEACLLRISNYANNLRFVNLDAQSGQYGGIKIENAKKIYIDGNINNCGIGYGKNPTNPLGALLSVKKSEFVDFNVTLWRMQKDGYRTKYGVYINDDCKYVTGSVQNFYRDDILNESPSTCVVRSTEDNPYLDENTLNRLCKKIDLEGNMLSCYPVEMYRIDVKSVIAASESLKKLTLTNYGNSEYSAYGQSQGGNTQNMYFDAEIVGGKTYMVLFECEVDYVPTQRLIQVIDGAGVVEAVRVGADERSFTVELPQDRSVTRLHFFAGNSAADSQGHTISVSSCILKELNGQYEVELAEEVTDAIYDWKKGELTKDGVVTKYEPSYIYAGAGKNTLEGNTSTILVKAAEALYAPNL